MNKTAILLAATLMTSTAAHAGFLAEATHYLSDNLSEADLVTILSDYPYRVSLETCGSETPGRGRAKCSRLPAPMRG
jgi:Tfp pilus assembly protein PilW